jgi:hypothetical protein
MVLRTVELNLKSNRSMLFSTRRYRAFPFSKASLPYCSRKRVPRKARVTSNVFQSSENKFLISKSIVRISLNFGKRPQWGAMTFSIMTLRRMPFVIMKLSRKTFSIMKLCRITFIIMPLCRMKFSRLIASKMTFSIMALS